MVLPKVSLFIGAIALSFQIGVLLPYHNKITSYLDELENNIYKFE